MEISKTYNPAEAEEKWYRYWMENGYFKADAKSLKPKYSIVIPPPNVTGILHMGHMLNNTIQDVLARRARMLGYETCWVPGTDHASIATEAKVVGLLKEKGLNKHDIGREEFLRHAWNWKEKYGGIILSQLKKLGCSCDWDRTRFTMEPKLSEAVLDVFVDLHEKGLIYHGKRMVNWDPIGKTALSDEEVITKESTLKLFYVKYPIAGAKGEFITIATSRPETIMADTAICIHPEDERYKHLHGRKAVIPLINREIPIILDEYVSMDFGTGCLKVTPAHDKNDYDLGVKHNLEFIDILNDDGSLNEKAVIYVGEDRFSARKKIGRELEEKGFLEKTEDYPSQVSTSERTGAIVEPRISLQWFIDMKKFLARNPKVLDSVMNDEIAFFPSKFKNTYKYWMENIKDWCISRQLWWGQRIPAWYAPDGSYAVARTADEAAEKLNKRNQDVEFAQVTPGDLRQDEDVLDTWFSSWLWPISVFDGFAKKGNEDIRAFYPTNVLVTAPEIIFFWVARMIFAGYEYMGEKPFRAVYFTGIVRDKQGRKMSKQFGNSPDALELINRFGADGVRMGMLLSSPAGNDLLFDESAVEQGRNFSNKIWNAYRLVAGWKQAEDETFDPSLISALNASGAWLDGRMKDAIADIDKKFEDYRLNEALMTVYKLIWDDFCSWYLEMVKPSYGEAVPRSIYLATRQRFSDLLKLLHPFMPFITEELFHELNNGKPDKPVIVSDMPRAETYEKKFSDRVPELVSQIRNIRSQKNISPKEALSISIQCSQEARAEYELFTPIIEKLANISTISFGEGSESAVQALVFTDSVFVDLGGLLDVEAEVEKINKELEYLRGFLKSVDAKLGNERFVANAKPDLVDRERQKKADAETKIRTLEENLNSLSKRTSQ